jgi:hypothetical protein
METKPPQYPSLGSAWLVNDTRETLNQCRIAFELRGPTGAIALQAITVDVPADSVQKLEVSLSLPAKVSELAPGDYKLAASAFSSSGALLGENLYDLAVFDIGNFEPGA